MRSSTLSTFAVVLAGLLGGCTVYSGLQSGVTGTAQKPKVVLVSDFTVTSDVVAIDRGYTARADLVSRIGRLSSLRIFPDRCGGELVSVNQLQQAFPFTSIYGGVGLSPMFCRKIEI